MGGNATKDVFVPALFTAEPGLSTIFKGDAVELFEASLYPMYEGIYQLRISVGLKEYDVAYPGGLDYVEFSVLPPTAATPAPSFKTAMFSNDGGQIFLDFDGDTDYGGTSRTFVCAELFTFPCAETSSCYWSSTSKVHLTFDYIPSQTHTFYTFLSQTTSFMSLSVPNLPFPRIFVSNYPPSHRCE